jgi:peptide-methionine (S)-S-oxide reductase
MAMAKSLWIRGFTAALLIAFAVSVALAKGSKQGEVPAPSSNTALAAQPGEESVVFSGGCFWGVQAVFQHVKGVTSATSGYSGGAASTAQYEEVSTGQTGHAESVKVVFDPSQVTYGQLLHIFFSVAHDPTQRDRQGPDEGSQYRSMVFYTTPEQQRLTKAYIEQLDGAHVFFPAEAHHQNYATLHPNDGYIQYNDAPKVENLKKDFPQLYRGSPQLVAVK